MTKKFDIIEYLSGLTGYVFDKAVLKSIALERGVADVEAFEELDKRTRDLLRADLLYHAYQSPNTMASSSQSHGGYSKSIGQQTITSEEKERLYNSFLSIYKKYDDEKVEEIIEQSGNLQWLNF